MHLFSFWRMSIVVWTQPEATQTRKSKGSTEMIFPRTPLCIRSGSPWRSCVHCINQKRIVLPRSGFSQQCTFHSNPITHQCGSNWIPVNHISRFTSHLRESAWICVNLSHLSFFSKSSKRLFHRINPACSIKSDEQSKVWICWDIPDFNPYRNRSFATSVCILFRVRCR
jgi:hypothetical protein